MYRIFSKKLILFLFALLVLDIAVSPYLSWGFARPSFLYLMLIYLAFEYDWHEILPVAFLVGLLRDMTGGVFLGNETVLLTLIVFVCDRSGRTVKSSSIHFKMSVTFIFVSAVQMINLIVLSFANNNIVFNLFNVSLVMKAALLNTLILPLFLYFTKRLFDKKRRYHQYELFR